MSTRLTRTAIAVLVVPTLVTLAACGENATAVGEGAYDIRFDFSAGFGGWEAGFVDYPVGKEAEWGIEAAVAPLPAPLDQSRRAIRLTGENHSDDLFMYVTRGITGLAPNATYSARFRVTIATSAPRNCAGIGGAPGESVVLKVGATPVEPARVVDEMQYYRANFDHGAQLAGGRDASPIGNIANSNANCAAPRYELKDFDTGASPVRVSTDSRGRLWLIVGIDSGFEGTTTVYLTAVRVSLGLQ